MGGVLASWRERTKRAKKSSARFSAKVLPLSHLSRSRSRRRRDGMDDPRSVPDDLHDLELLVGEGRALSRHVY